MRMLKVIFVLAAATATGCGQNAKDVARLDRFVGTWQGFGSRSTPGDISATSFNVVATQPTRGTLVVECPNPTFPLGCWRHS